MIEHVYYCYKCDRIFVKLFLDSHLGTNVYLGEL